MKLAICLAVLASSPAWADDLPAPPPAPADGAPSEPPPPPPPPAEEAPMNLPPPVTVTPPPAPAPPASPSPAPAPTTTVVAPVPPKADEPAKPFVDDYYDRKRGVGMFHQSRMAIGVLKGTEPNFVDGMAPATPGEEKSATRAELAFEGVYLGIPSAYGHFHGIEFSTGLRSAPIDFWAQFGTAVSLFNIGRGGPGSLRVGGSFGAGFNLAHGYGYVRGRAAIVLIPAQLDAEVSAMWTPESASTGNYDELVYRASVWYRPGGSGGSKRAFEVFGEMYHRTDDAAEREKEFTGVGAGVGMTLF